MKKLTLDISLTLPFIIILFLYSLTSLQIAANLNPIFRFALIVVALIIYFLIIQHRKIEIKKVMFFFPAILFEIYYILLNFNQYQSTSSNFSIFYQGMLFIILFIISSFSWKKLHMFYFSLFSILLYILVTYYALTIRGSIGIIDTNSIGAYSYYLSFFPLVFIVQYSKMFKRFKILVLFLYIVSLIVMSGTRSVILCIAFGLITFTLWKFITKNRFLYNLYFSIFLIGIYFFTVIYPKLDIYLKNFLYYNNLFIKYTGKNLLSGRQHLWNDLISLIAAKPYFGYGSGVLPSVFMDTKLSSHNLYLQIGLQTGIVGVALLVIFLFAIWNKLRTCKHNIVVRIVACYLIGIIVHQTFEVTLTQNNFTLGILQWIILGFGLSYCFNETQKTNS